MTSLADMLAQLSPEQRELFEMLLQEKQAQPQAAVQAIPRRAAQDSAPLSFGQQRLWFIHQWEPESPAYHLPQAVHLQGRLDRAALERSLNEIVRRHETLRARFVSQDGQPVQIIAPSLQLAIPLEQIGGAPTEAQAAVQRRLVEEARQPFDLERGPLLRARLFQLGHDQHVMLLTMHHIISDGWSNGVLVRELGTLYPAFAAGQPAPLADLPLQYADFAAWQRQTLQGELLEQQLAYWRQRLAGAPPLLALPTDRPRPLVQRYSGARHALWLPPAQTEALRALSQREGASLFMTLMAAFLVLLYRYSGQTDLVVGTPIANRTRTEIEGLIGFFVNTLVLRADLAGGPSFRELLAQVRQTTLEMQDHQDLPFERLVEELQLGRNTSYAPLFQICMALQNAPLPALTAPGLTLAPLAIDDGTSQFDLYLELYEAADGLRGQFKYNTDLFDAATIARMAQHFQTLLASITADPAESIERLVLLTASERQQLLELHANTRPFPAEQTLHAWFGAQAAQAPDRIALSDGDLQLSYGELDRRSSQLAHELCARGVGPETLVGLCVERSALVVIGILGILKAGGAYLPLDPSYPSERLHFMLEDAGVTLLLTEQALGASRWQALPTQPMAIALDADWPQIAQQPAQPPATAATPASLAYVIYTSGSTGTPKGCMVSHANVVRLFSATEQWYGFRQDDVWTLFHSYTFDFSVWELWGPLLYGGRLVVVPHLTSRSPDAFYALLLQERVTVLNQTPSAFRQLSAVDEQQGSADELALRLIIFGGEALEFASLRGWLARHGDSRPQLVNMYGITETTVHVTYRPLRRADVEQESSSLIGVPIGDLSLFILDAQGQPVPIGVAGELYVGGAGVARGYLNRPELTEARFVPAPFAAPDAAWVVHREEHEEHEEHEGCINQPTPDQRILDNQPASQHHAAKPTSLQPQASSLRPGLKPQASSLRLYRTGDRARHLANGDIAYMGRIDQQIKIRGFRVELGEIEAALSGCVGVRAATVVVREDTPGDARLVAYLVPTAEPAPASAELRAALLQRLPEYMVPSVFVTLAALPLTSSGKVDRQALPQPASQRPSQGAALLQPRTPAEMEISLIWAEVLALDSVGITESFFDLGGHSLLATQVMSRICKAFELQLPLRTLFDHPTVAQLAVQVEYARAAQVGVAPAPIVAVPRGQPFPLSFAQEQLWLADQMVPDNVAYVIPAMARVRGPLDLDILQRCFDALIQRHEIFRTTYHYAQEALSQHIHPPEPFSLRVVDLRDAPDPEEEAKRLTRLTARTPIDLRNGPLARGVLYQLAEQEYAALLLMHHVIVDRWSSPILMRELRELYEAYASGRPPALPALPVQYADFAHWQRAQLQGPVLAAQLDYWRRQLAGAPTYVELTTDRPRPPIQTYRGAYRMEQLDPQLFEQVQALGRAAHATLFMTFLAAFYTLLYRYSGQGDMVLGTPITNRSRVEVEGLIGYFLNMLLLRVQLGDNPSFRELLGRVRDTCLSAYAHQDVQFERLVQELLPTRDMSRTALYNIMFVFSPNYPMADVTSSDLTVSHMFLSGEVSRCDLTMYTFVSAGGQASVQINYNTDLFDHATIERMATHFQVLLRGMVADPDQRLLGLPLLAAPEQQQITELWNATARPYRQDTSLHQQIAAQAASRPDAVALVFEGQQISYGVLDRRANQLAQHLRGLGVGPDVPVGVYLQRCPDLVVALLGVLKAGGAYVPLDPAYPLHRLSFMLADSGAAVLLTQQELAGTSALTDRAFGAQHWPVLVRLDSDWPQIAKLPAQAPGASVDPASLAYVIYTSGSTGQPKGVMNTHGAILNRIQWMQEAYQLEPHERVLQKTPFSFDVSVWEFFWPLVTGACLVLARPEGHRDPGYLAELIQRTQITTLHFVPPMLQVFLDHADAPGCRSLQRVICSGEALPHELQQRCFARLPQAALHNLYGPTEAAVDVSYWACRRDDPRPLVPIGFPVANTQLYVLDRSLRPVPVGVPGELYIGGVQLARGYLNRPALTAERFVPNPFAIPARTPAFQHEEHEEHEGCNNQPTRHHAALGSQPASQHHAAASTSLKPQAASLRHGLKPQASRLRHGLRLYSTGDRARYLPDGSIDFLGRLDFQVKIRGFRIELGEIEAALAQHPAVREGVVLAREDQPGERRLVAYVVPQAGQTLATDELRSALKEQLPAYMLPAALVVLPALPLSPNGKLDRQALPVPDGVPAAQRAAYRPPRNAAEQTIAAIWQELLGVEQVGIHDNFFDLGGHSLLVVQAHSRLAAAFDGACSLTDMFQYTTIAALAQHLSQANPAPAQSAQSGRPAQPAPASDAIAIIGMVGRFPGANDLEQFWHNLRDGIESVASLSDAQLRAAGVDDELLAQPNYVKANPLLDDIDCFDARFFGISPREAEVMDPQQRIFLEYAWRALEHAGYDPHHTPERIGVYAGQTLSAYLLSNLYPHQGRAGAPSIFQALLGNSSDYLATQVAYRLNLKGPAFSVQTACSTSLVAIHLACQGLIRDECAIALAGGVSIRVPQVAGYLYEPGGIASPDGHCRPFDAQAQGTVSGSGVGVVVLKRLDRALADGDTIHAVIKGSAINNDGARKIGYTAPSQDGQVEVIRAALAAAGVAAETVSYIEAHGTGTVLGDPLEVAALTRVFRASTSERGFCGLGSVKGNIGHLDAAAGVAGLIKTVLALTQRQLPPSINYSAPNPQLDLANSPFYINATLRDWQTAEGQPRRAGVSSFGIGGTNAHVVLEQAPVPTVAQAAPSEQLLVWSARSAAALQELTDSLVGFLRAHPQVALADLAHTMQVGRTPFEYRASLVCSDSADALAALEQGDPQRIVHATAEPGYQPVVFLFPGQGTQYVNMGRGLYESEPLFRAAIEQCATLLQPHLKRDLLALLYPAPGQEEPAALEQTQYAQPALFAVGYALAQLWQSWGLQPAALIGHSVGEYVAACLAGVFSLADALALVAARGRLLQALPGGAMLSVPLAQAELAAYLQAPLDLAAVNGPQLCSVAGPTPAIEALQLRLAQDGIDSQRLHTSHAFHSAMMEPMLAQFSACVAQVALQPPQLPFVSNVSGSWITAEQATDPHYWASHVRSPVQFAAGLRTLLDTQHQILLEVGPGRTLSTLARQQQALAVFSSLPHARDSQADRSFLLRTLGRLWLSGLTIDWRSFAAAQPRRRIPLPTYPFARERYWIAPPARSAAASPFTAWRKAANPSEWLYVPVWQPSVAATPDAALAVWAIIGGAGGPSAELAGRLQAAGHTVHQLPLGEPAAPDYTARLAALDPAPQRIVYCANAAPNPADLIQLAQALGQRRISQLYLLTNGAQLVSDSDLVDPAQALLQGLALVIPQEYADLTCRCIDIAAPAQPWQAAQLYDRLLVELNAATDEPLVAYRGARRWVQRFQALNPPAQAPSALREGGVYLITGGLGHVGQTLARELAQAAHARLVLTSRTALPPHDSFVAELEALGAEVLVLAADVADPAQMRAVIAQTRQHYGTLHGVVHAAGLAGHAAVAALQELDQSFCETVFRAKVQGTQTLAEVLHDLPLDFCILCSSLTAVLGGLGYAADAAANRFMDAFAQRHSQLQPTPWLSLNWDAWHFAHDHLRGSGWGASVADLAIAPDEGRHILELALRLGQLPQVIISTSNLQARFDHWVKRAGLAAEPRAGAALAARHSRPNLSNGYVAPRNQIEQELLEMWQQLLGITEIGVYDSFFELGGHSLLATQVTARIRNHFGVQLPVRQLLESPTVAALAQAIVEQQLGAVTDQDEQDVEALLAEVAQLSEHDIQRLLAE